MVKGEEGGKERGREKGKGGEGEGGGAQLSIIY